MLFLNDFLPISWITALPIVCIYQIHWNKLLERKEHNVYMYTNGEHLIQIKRFLLPLTYYLLNLHK